MSESMVGRELGAYRVGRPIGRGGIGEVYEAVHGRTSRSYAVKILLNADDDAVRRFRREAEALSAIGHPGVVAIHDFDQTDDGLTYLIMDKLDGEDLAARLERGPMALGDALERFGEAANALAAAHRAGVLHRDLKPSNIFLARDSVRGERAMLLDFGLARSVDPQHTRLTATGQTMGTPLYMSPEQALGETLDVRSDVYSLAAVLYEMLCGEPPFDGPTVTAILSKVLTVAPPPLSMRGIHVPSHVEDAILRALSKDRAHRPDGVAEFIGAVTDGRVVLPPTRQFRAAGTAERDILPTRAVGSGAVPTRNRGKLLVVGGLVAILSAVVVAGVVMLRTPEEVGGAVSLPVPPPADSPPEVALEPPAPPIETGPSEPVAQPSEPIERDTQALPASESQSVSMRRRAPLAPPTPPPSSPPSVPTSVVPADAIARNNATIDSTISASRARIASFEQDIAVFERVSRMSTAELCGASYLRGVEPDRAERVNARVGTSRRSLCDLQAEVFPVPPDVQRRIAHLRDSFERHRRDIARRDAETLSDADRQELLDRLAAVERISGQDPYPCFHPAHETLRVFARELGAQAAQPGLQVGYSVNGICNKARRLPDALERVHSAASRAVATSRINIATQRDVISQLEQRRL